MVQPRVELPKQFIPTLQPKMPRPKNRIPDLRLATSQSSDSNASIFLGAGEGKSDSSKINT